ncbi:MAG: hypothetical protein WCJ85_09720 [Chitinophagaceae bacterium]
MELQIEFDKAVAFINSIGISVIFQPIESASFLPGLSIHNGSIMVDKTKLKYPGDILHEAGHIAVVPAAERATLCEADIAVRKDRGAEEMMSIAWSYAACIHLQLDPSFVFHDQGYKGGGGSIADNFSQGQYFGVPMLQWVGLALEEKRAAEENKPAYPVMLQWIRD